MTAPFKMRKVFFIVALLAPVIALALPDDATLSRLLVGTWHGQLSVAVTFTSDRCHDGGSLFN
jgi:hypothetical protein